MLIRLKSQSYATRKGPKDGKESRHPEIFAIELGPERSSLLGVSIDNDSRQSKSRFWEQKRFSCLTPKKVAVRLTKKSFFFLFGFGITWCTYSNRDSWGYCWLAGRLAGWLARFARFSLAYWSSSVIFHSKVSHLFVFLVFSICYQGSLRVSAVPVRHGTADTQPSHLSLWQLLPQDFHWWRVPSAGWTKRARHWFHQRSVSLSEHHQSSWGWDFLCILFLYIFLILTYISCWLIFLNRSTARWAGESVCVLLIKKNERRTK